MTNTPVQDATRGRHKNYPSHDSFGDFPDIKEDISVLKMIQWNEHWVVPQPGGMLIATSFTFAKNIRSRLAKPAVLAGTVVTSFLLDSLHAETGLTMFEVYRNDEPEKILNLLLDTSS